MNCPICHKPTPPDSVHTCSPVPLLTAEVADKLLSSGHWRLWPKELLELVCQIARKELACYDTATHVAVPKMTEAEAREKWRTGLCCDDFDSYLAALRDIEAIKQ